MFIPYLTKKKKKAKKTRTSCKLNHYFGININVIRSLLSWEKMSQVQTMQLKEQQILPCQTIFIFQLFLT